MLTRAWFALSVLWAVFFLFAAASNQSFNDEARFYTILALSPFVIGAVFKVLLRYITSGTLRRG